ncbi:MAG: RecQ family ATP-dependent DNA helicase, partial [Chloroflexota bacterium]
GRHALVVMPTGSGKSLIYQLAALLLPGVTLVISPLVALMKDQVDSLARRNIAATFINSSLDAMEIARRTRAMTAGEYKIVLVAPERLRSRKFLDALAPVPISLLAVDEAHCMSQWGHDFRPDYLRIPEARALFKPPVTLALTATATPRVQDDILQLLGLTDAERLVTGFNRPNLTLEVLPAHDPQAKLRLLREFLADADGAGIIYTGTRKDAEEIAAYVREVVGRNAQHYHGTLDPARRVAVQDAFMAGDLPIVVATNAFGMGIDRPDVRFVLHYALPGTLEAYYQEAGRAGRDGLPARATLLYAPRDVMMHEHFIENDTPSADDLRAVHRFLSNQRARGDETRVTFETLERATGLPNTKMRVALEQLEAARALRRGHDEAGTLNLSVQTLAAAALRATVAQSEQRREHKRKLLDLMIGYAETEACRRRTLLDYFGDHSAATALVCCDNCLARAATPDATTPAPSRPATTQAERAALIVLDTVAHLKWEVGKSKLTHILHGSNAQDMALYATARNFGKFASLRQSEIEALIVQLLESGYLRQAGGARPTLTLTPRGETTLKARAAIEVTLRPVRAGSAEMRKAEREAGGTILLTGELHRRGLGPEQIAAERSLTVGTVYAHLARLIADG